MKATEKGDGVTKNIERYYEFYDFGTEDDAETVVFLPGVACSTWMFREAVPLFNPKYKVLIFNNPGTNGTNVPFNLTVEKIAKMVLDVLDHLNLKNCTLVGHSMGGFTSQQLYKIAPERVKNLVLVATSCGHPFTKSEISRLVKDLGSNFWKRARDFKDKPEDGINYTFSDYFIKNKPVKYKMFAHRFFEMRPKQTSIAKHFICAARFSSFDFLQDIQVPTFIVHGKEDKLIQYEGAVMLHGKIKGSELLSYPHCGHFPMVEEDDFYDKVEKFMEQNVNSQKEAS